LPGFTDTPSNKVSKPTCVNDSLVKSASPTETPPDVIIKSAPKELFIYSFIDSIESFACPIKLTSQPSSLALATKVGVFELYIWYSLIA
jgi:hypothetical protein